MTNKPTKEQAEFLDKHEFSYDGFIDVYQSKKFNFMFRGSCLNQHIWEQYKVALIMIISEHEETMKFIGKVGGG